MNDQEMFGSMPNHLPNDQRQIELAWQTLRNSGWDAEKSAALIQAVHGLAGTASTLNENHVGNAARRFIHALNQTSGTPDWASLETMFADLRNALLARQGDKLVTQVQETKQNTRNLASLQETRSTNLIYIVENDPVQTESLAAQTSHFGYAVQTFTHLAELRAALRQNIPTAILMDIVFPEDKLAGAAEILAIEKEFGEQLTVFFLSVRDDATARIQAIRAGGKGYFAKPVDIGMLIDELDKLIVNQEPLPYRVVIVDDSQIQAQASAIYLRKARMETLIVTQPFQVLHAIEDFSPDLLLLDLYMPECTGFELAQMIRQVKAYVSLPIVYLSSETDREKQLEAVGLGGDDFLTKPIRPDHLISAVTSRIERYRQLQSLMLHDSLTGLLNHTTARERLDQEVAHAGRDGAPLALAMIDLDQFKHVNDTYGHATGDRVLKSIAHLLSRRLRRSDIIGRYGGEEFIVVLPNTNLATARDLMNELRDAFGRIRHVSDGKDFGVTLSCGIAAFPEKATLVDLAEAADQALYVAKRQGRNQVAVAK